MGTSQPCSQARLAKRSMAAEEMCMKTKIKMDSHNVPSVALFEADGGAWINQATENIVQYIQSMVSDIPVIA